jgi:ABC-2 type transport system permease protein
MREWWQGMTLVAGRSMAEQLRSRAFKVVTGLLLLISAAAVIVPQVVGVDDTTYTLATVGEAPPELAAMLESAQEAGEFGVEFDSYDDRAEVRDAVEQGDATAGLVDDTLFTSSQADGTFPVLVAQAVVALETSTRLSDAGLTPVQVARVQDVRPPAQVPVSQVADEGRAGVGFAVGIVLYLALTFAGSGIATTVAMEKSTRISEVLLAVLRPSQALVGTVLAVGAVTLAQVLVLAVPMAVAVRVTDSVGLPAVATGDLALAIAWFLLGFALYAFLFAASAALVDKITEASSAILPVMTVLIVAYVLSVTMVPADPSSPASVFASLFPFTAPVAMPIRWATGDVPVYQLVAAMLLTALTAVVLVRLAAAIYSRALVITGRRARWREVLH